MNVYSGIYGRMYVYAFVCMLRLSVYNVHMQVYIWQRLHVIEHMLMCLLQLAMHTLPAITNMPPTHMHTKPSATCHCYSQIPKRREALEHAHRQRRDLIVAETPAQAHTHTHTYTQTLGQSGYAAGSRVRAVHRDALSQWHACKNGWCQPSCKPHTAFSTRLCDGWHHHASTLHTHAHTHTCINTYTSTGLHAHT